MPAAASTWTRTGYASVVADATDGDRTEESVLAQPELRLRPPRRRAAAAAGQPAPWTVPQQLPRATRRCCGTARSTTACCGSARRRRAPANRAAAAGRRPRPDASRYGRLVDLAQPAPGFDTTLGFRFDEVSARPRRAELDRRPEQLQPNGIVHGGVYCTAVETAPASARHCGSASAARSSACQQHQLPARRQRGHAASPPPRRCTAAAASSCGWSRSPTSRTAPSPAARCGSRTSPADRQPHRPSPQ